MYFLYKEIIQLTRLLGLLLCKLCLQHVTLLCRSEVFAKPTVSTCGLHLSYKYVEHPVSERLLKVDVFI